MRIVDAHLHFSRIEVFADTARLFSGADYSADGLIAECAENGVEYAIGMGLTEGERFAFPDESVPTPMPCDLPNPPPFLYSCAGVNPYTLNDRTFSKLEAALQNPRNVGLKIYAGYYPIPIYDDIYDPVYVLAEIYNKPVCIHAGDTFSERGLLKYSHPLNADRLAVKFPGVNFVLAHMGDPWIMDACEAAYKNKNIFLDTSGLAVGEPAEADRIRKEPLLRDRFRQGLLFLNNYSKIIFGTDWPLIAMKPYIEMCKSLVDEPHWEKLFWENAVRVYGVGKHHEEDGE